MNELPNTREAARALDMNRYFTGHPCRNGHIAPRRVQNDDCVACRKIRERRRRARREAEKFE